MTKCLIEAMGGREGMRERGRKGGKEGKKVDFFQDVGSKKS